MNPTIEKNTINCVSGSNMNAITYSGTPSTLSMSDNTLINCNPISGGVTVTCTGAYTQSATSTESCVHKCAGESTPSY